MGKRSSVLEHWSASPFQGRRNQTDEREVVVMGWGGVALQRTKLIDLPEDLEAAVVPNGRTEGGRDRYSWKYDGYGIVSVSVYLPAGERLPSGGVTLTLADFDPARGTDKPRRGSEVGAYHDPTVGGKGESLDIFVEAPKGFDHFKSITIDHA